jgi:DNA-binding transcriptional ArsR family regulator
MLNHMVERQAVTVVDAGTDTGMDVDTNTDMDAVFHALASEARRGMLGRLAVGELTVSQLAEPLSMSLAAASKHIQVLERAGLIRRTVTGRRHLCRLEPGPLRSAQSWLRFYERFWSQRLDALEAVLAADPAAEPPSGG